MNQRISSLNTTDSNQRSTTNQNTRQNTRQRVVGQNTSTRPQRTVGTPGSNYASSRTPASLHVGDVLRGEITDLRNNEISITLEDNTVVRAKINDSSSYSIGQTGSFRLSDISAGTIYLENISAGYDDTEFYLINKALEESNLPVTQKNQITVKALMDNMLPINRESIQNLIQQAYDCNTEDMNTLAVMKRLMMQTDEESVRQFSNYRNNNYELLSRLDTFSKDIPALLNTLSNNGPADMVTAFGKNLLSISLSSTPVSQKQPILSDLPVEVQNDIDKMLSNTSFTDDISEQLDHRTLSLQDTMTLIRDAALSGTLVAPEGSDPSEISSQIQQLIHALEPSYQNQENENENIFNNSIFKQNVEDSVPKENENEPSIEPILSNQETEGKENSIQNRLAFAGKLFQSISESAKNTITERLESFRSPNQETSNITNSKPSSLDILTQTYEKFARNSDLLSTYLSKEDRNELLNHLQNMPISRSMLLKISSGEASTRNVLTAIYNSSSLADNEQIKSLFQSDVFEKLFSRELQSEWTMTPEQLKQEDVSDFYNQLHKQMNAYRQLIQSTLSGSDSEQLSGMAQDIESNISFMKTLSETFSYFQLPLKLPNQDAHGDLYVYSKKENLRKHPDKTSIVLHLNMEHLGEIDIRLDRNKNDILANFSLNDTPSVNLFEVNADMLKNALNTQGYACQINIHEKEQPSLTVEQFINTKVNTHQTDDMKRFSFDIRA